MTKSPAQLDSEIAEALAAQHVTTMTAAEYLAHLNPGVRGKAARYSFVTAPFRVVITLYTGSAWEYTASKSFKAAARDARRRDVRAQQGRVIQIIG